MLPQTEKKLGSLQKWFLRLVLQVGPGAPAASLLWDFGLLGMGLRIWLEKIMMAYHIKRLDEDSLARKVYDEQIENSWPGLAKEVQFMCQDLLIENVNTTKLSSKLYRAEVLKACHKKNAERLKYEASDKIKCTNILKENYGKKAYVSESQIHKVRQIYKLVLE